MTSVHKWLAVVGSCITDSDAATLGERIETLTANGAVVDKKILVDDARPESSPTHRFFEWNESLAAERYRLQQAHHYLKSILVEIIPDTGGEPIPIRAFHCVTINQRTDMSSKHGYVPVARALADDELWSQVLQKAKSELMSWQRRYKTYKNLQPIADGPIQTIIDSL